VEIVVSDWWRWNKLEWCIPISSVSLWDDEFWAITSCVMHRRVGLVEFKMMGGLACRFRFTVIGVQRILII
jgi:hypothetical protein